MLPCGDKQYLFSPYNQTEGVHLAYCLVAPSQERIFPIKIMNTWREPITVRAHSSVGTVEGYQFTLLEANSSELLKTPVSQAEPTGLVTKEKFKNLKFGKNLDWNGAQRFSVVVVWLEDIFKWR